MAAGPEGPPEPCLSGQHDTDHGATDNLNVIRFMCSHCMPTEKPHICDTPSSKNNLHGSQLGNLTMLPVALTIKNECFKYHELKQEALLGRFQICNVLSDRVVATGQSTQETSEDQSFGCTLASSIATI